VTTTHRNEWICSAFSAKASSFPGLHWLVFDEVHHCLPAKWHPAPTTLPRELPAAIAVTVHPEEVAPEFLSLVSTVIGVGEGASRAI